MSTPPVRIENLAAHPALAPVLAAWVQAEWGHLLPERTEEMLVAAFRQRTAPHVIPESFVAMAGDRPVGMASLIEDDMKTRPDLSPWLAAVYVLPEFRNRGVGSRLVQAVMAEASTLGVERLYLFTPDQEAFYRRLGWRTLERTNYRGENVVIMVYEVCEGDPQ
jgi:GNAT superfamily N-acetyltransferase